MKSKLKNQILLSNALIFVGFAVLISILSYNFYFNSTRNEIFSLIDSQNQIIENSLETIFESNKDYLKITSTDLKLQDTLAAVLSEDNLSEDLRHEVYNSMSAILSNVIYPTTSIVGGAVSLNGEILYSGYSINEDEAMAIFTQEYMQELKDSQGVILKGLHTLRFTDNTEKNVFTIGKSIIGKQTGQYLGECVLFIDEATVNLAIDGALTNSEIILLDENNIVVSAANKDYLYKSTAEIESLKFIDVDAGQTVVKGNVYYKINEAQGLKILNLYTHTADFNSNAVYFITLAAISIVAFVLIVIFTNIANAKLIKSVEKIEDSMMKASKGDYTVRLTEDLSYELRDISTSFNILIQTIDNYIAEIYRQEQVKRELEFKILQAQINPHFLYNTIETIISFVTLKMDVEAKKIAVSLANFYKLMLSKGEDIITVKEEFLLSETYINIQNLRYGEFVDFDIEYEDIGDNLIPKLTLQPIIENALYHGVKEGEKKGLIKIYGYEKDGEILIEITDNGVGIDKESIDNALKDNSSEKSFGLYNINNRLKLKFGNNYGIKIQSEVNKYTKVTVNMPKKID